MKTLGCLRLLVAGWAVLMLIVCLTLLPAPAHGQTWRKALTVAAVGTLWVDYCQIHQQMDLGWDRTEVLGTPMGYRTLAAVNAVEIGANLFAPRRYRPWLNLATVLFHIPYILQAARFPIGLAQYPRGERVLHLGIRITP